MKEQQPPSIFQGKFSSKHSLPYFDVDRRLPRKNLFDLALTHLPRKKALLIEAQPGQGKTTLALQLLTCLETPYAWYQLGPEDSDPATFIPGVLASLMKNLAGFRSPLLEEMIAKRELVSQGFRRFIKILAKDLADYHDGDLILVLEDMHMLGDSRYGLGSIAALLEETAPGVRFILTSRRPILPTVQTDLKKKDFYILDNSALAFTNHEIAEFFNQILQFPISVDSVRKLHKTTDGWPMGLSLLGATLAKNENQKANPATLSSDHISRENIFEYFKDEIFAQVPHDLIPQLLQLSLLNQIPVALASQLLPQTDARKFLKELTEHHLFLRLLESNEEVYGFHHFFRDFLKRQAHQELPPEIRRQVLQSASTYYKEKGRFEESLDYLLKSQDFEGAEKLLRQIGMLLLSTNRHSLLHRMLAQLPNEFVHNHPWLSYYQGVLFMESTPAEALPLLLHARDLFHESVEHLGELLACAQIIQYRVLVDGLFKESIADLERVKELYAALETHLDAYAKVQITQLIAAGYCFFHYSFEKAEQYSNIALELAKENGLTNFLAIIRGVRTYNRNYQGKFPLSLEEIEKTLPLIRSHRVSEIYKTYLLFSRVNYLALICDWKNYQTNKEVLINHARSDISLRGVPGGFIAIWQTHFAIRENNLDHAEAIILQSQQVGSVTSAPHIRSQLLQFQAYIQAQRGDRDKSLETLAEAIKLREIAGGSRFIIRNRLVAGVVYTLAEKYPEAETMLDMAREASADFSEDFLLAAAYLNRARLFLRLKQTEKATLDIKEGFSILRQHGYPDLYDFYPEAQEEVLPFAIAEGLDPEVARRLARINLGVDFTETGKRITLLSLKTLGPFSVKIGGQEYLSANQLTPGQRELLALLIAAPNMRLSQDEVQLALWPESSPKKARSNYDNLVSRLRKALSEAIAPLAILDYLVVAKGMISMEFCRVDVLDFKTNAAKGIGHFQRKEYWQASNSFHLAFDEWQGNFFKGAYLGDAVSRFQDEILSLYLKSALCWAESLSQLNQHGQATGLLEQVWPLDPTNNELARTLYNLYSLTNQPTKAQKVLTQYEASLREAGYEPDEIRHLLDALWS